MANETTTATLANLIPEIIAEALFVAQEQSIMRGLVRNYNLPMGSGKTVDVPFYTPVTADTVAEGADLSSTAVTTSKATLTVGEVGVMATVTDFALRTAQGNVVSDVGQLFGNAIAKKMDVDLMSLFSGFTTAVGDGNVVASIDAVFEAVARLSAVGVGPEGLALVLHPYIAYDIKSEINSAAYAGSDIMNEAMRNGYVGTLAGVPVFESGNVPITAGDSIGGLFHRDALGLAVLQDIAIEQQRDASLRATELVATATYGAGELYDAYGVALNFDSSIAG